MWAGSYGKAGKVRGADRKCLLGRRFLLSAFLLLLSCYFFLSFFEGGNGFLTLKMKELETSFQFLVQKVFFFLLIVPQEIVLRYSVSASIPL